MLALSPVPDNMPMNRLALARWLTDGQHPLTAHALVNRLWEQLFGVGIVKSSENLGVQTDWPSHPQLLDRLAVDFVEHGWNYQAHAQADVDERCLPAGRAATNSERLRLDPENRLLSRGPRTRLAAEMVRDRGTVPLRLDGRETRWAEHVGLSASWHVARGREAWQIQAGSRRKTVPAQSLLAHPSYRRASQHAVVRRRAARCAPP